MVNWEAIGIGLAAGSMVAACLAYVLNLGGRLSAHEKGCDSRQAMLDERHTTIGREIGDVKQRIDEVRQDVKILLQRHS